MIKAIPGPIPACTRLAPADLDTRIRVAENAVRFNQDALVRIEGERLVQRRACSDLVVKANVVADQVKPMVSREKLLCMAVHVTRWTGPAAIPLGLTAALCGSPTAGLGLLAASALLVGGSIGVNRLSRAKLATLSPRIDRLMDVWKGVANDLDNAQKNLSALEATASSVSSDLTRARGDLQVLEMARGLERQPKPEESIKKEADAVVIGTLRIPRRNRG
jgi:hypothetical protein